MKKSLVFLIIAAALGLLLARERPFPTTKVVEPQNVSNTTTTASSNTNQQSSSNANNSTSNQTPHSASSIKDGSFSGSKERNQYETIQVAIEVSSGKITKIDVPVLNYTEGGRSIQIVEYALPILKQRAIQAQSADIEYVSGATKISYSFMDSLSSAIQSAKS